MSKKSKIVIGCLVVCLCVVNFLIFSRKGSGVDEIELHMDVKTNSISELQVYYGVDMGFTEENSTKTFYDNPGHVEELVFRIPSNTSYIRIDIGSIIERYEISSVCLKYHEDQWKISNSLIRSFVDVNQLILEENENGYLATSLGDDPYITLNVSDNALQEIVDVRLSKIRLFQNILFALFINAGAVFDFAFRKKIITLPVELWKNRKLIIDLSVNDFKTKYAGSYLGIVWAFIQPIVTILVYWFVFTVGLKAGRVAEYPFVLYLVTGIVPWFFFQDALNGGTNALIEYNYLVKKVVFKISILPVVKIISAFFVHVFFVAFSLILCAAYGYLPDFHTIQLIYYSACTFVFTLGLVYATSAVVIFFRDLTQIINILLQVGMWLTPIMWDLTMLDSYPLLKSLFKLNPLYYIVCGYRDTMLGKVWFIAHWKWAFYFWAITAVLFLFGTLVFKRLKPHFADVL